MGSTNIKYAINGENFSVAFPLPVNEDPTKGIYEVDCNRILQTIKTIIDGFCCDTVLLSVQMHGYVLSDGNGASITPYISWRDERFATSGLAYPFVLGANSGTSLKANLPLLSVLALFAADENIKNKARIFDTLGSYIVRKLTGNHVAELTDACPTGCYDAREKCANMAIMNTYPYYLLKFPSLCTGLFDAGNYCGKKICAAFGDQQSSVYGLDVRRGTLIYNTGTASQLCVVRRGFCEGNYESRPFFFGDTLCTVSGLTGGRNYSPDASAAIKMTDELRVAVKKLGGGKRAVACGGLALHNRGQITRTFASLGVQCDFSERGALDGLQRLFAKSNN